MLFSHDDLVLCCPGEEYLNHLVEQHYQSIGLGGLQSGFLVSLGLSSYRSSASHGSGQGPAGLGKVGSGEGPVMNNF